MKKLSGLLLLMLLTVSASASHNRGGYISYRQVSGLTYEATVVTYTSSNSPADRPFLEVKWGDGSFDTLARTGNGIIIGDGSIKENTYIGLHTYVGVGNYIISVEDPNRNGGIVNIPNSVNVPFFIQSELRLSNFLVSGGSSRPAGIINFHAQVGVAYVQNLAFYDPDADFLSFSLTTPRGADGELISGYSLPNGVTVNAQNGEFIWNSPQEIGDFVFTMLVQEYKEGIMVGSVLVDFQVFVSSDGFTGEVSEIASWPTNGLGNFSITVEPDEMVDLNLRYADGSADSVQLVVYGEPLIVGNTGAFSLDSGATDFRVKRFSWTPTIANARCAPYILSFRGNSFHSNKIRSRDVSLLVYVHNQSVFADPECLVWAGIADSDTERKRRTTAYPNPFSESSVVRFATPKKENYRFDLYNSCGKFVLSQTGSTSEALNLDGRNLGLGIYFYTVFFSNGKVEQGKVVVAGR